MPLTPEHINRLADFCEARILEVGGFPAFGPPRDDTDRLPRALYRTVRNLRACGVLLDASPSASQPMNRLSATFAWDFLRNIAKEWRDHPDYRPEFTREPWELEEAGR